MIEETPRFAADRMVGRLARWLRLLGVDVLYSPSLGG
ncbi:MAG: Mut7-C RNAse domain-containing protein, partial [Candidatus Binataceae bacterium]